MLAQGLTLTSSTLGSFFYLIVGTHALHAIVALGLLCRVWHRHAAGWLQPSQLATAAVFWYFVVGAWPVIYWQVYFLGARGARCQSRTRLTAEGSFIERARGALSMAFAIDR